MSTTHLFAFNGDRVSDIKGDPHDFVHALLQCIRTSGIDSGAVSMLHLYGVTYITQSMGGIRGAVERAEEFTDKI